MEYIDLSYEINEKTQMYPGLFKPKICKDKVIENDGVNIKRLSIITHTGTHIDAPRHFYKNGMTIDKLPLNKFVGEAAYLDFSNTELGSVISIKEIIKFNDLIQSNDIIILNTGIYKKYSTDEFNTEYPTITIEVANWLVKKNIATFATDATSVDIDGENIIHKILLASNIPIIENLTNLNKITRERVKFIALPLKIDEGDGSPCRAIIIQG